MIDITHKSSTYRQAIASARVKASSMETIQAIKNNQVPKGNVLEAARIAALFGVKKTAELIPDCHPMPVEKTSVDYELGDIYIDIKVEVATVYKTGVEVEAMHGASIAALTMYDMLKPIDKGVSIESIQLEKKKGGKSSYKESFHEKVKAAVIVVSDSVSKGEKEDKAGLIIKEKLVSYDVDVQTYAIIPDDIDKIQLKVQDLLSAENRLIILTGGTGLSPKDYTPDAIKPLLDMEVPGIMEVARNYGQNRMPYAMLSRGVAGMVGRSLIITMPGSSGGAKESMDALFPFVLHIFKVQEESFRHGQ